MAQMHITLSLNTCEMQLMIGEMAARVRALGQDEAERRVGCEMDEAFFQSLFKIEHVSGGELRAAPTPELDRCIAALW